MVKCPNPKCGKPIFSLRYEEKPLIGSPRPRQLIRFAVCISCMCPVSPMFWEAQAVLRSPQR